nr:YpmS family protein [Bacillus benzoevorans]
MKHHWKRLFFLLLGLNLMVMVILLILFNLPIEDRAIPDQGISEEESISLAIKTNKKDINKLIDHYIRKESGDFDYKVYLDESEVVLLGEIPILGMMIDMKMTFEPSVLKNGDLLLEQRQFSLGRFHLPVPILLKIMQESYSFPEWITIQPKQQQIYVALNQMKLKSDSRLKVKKFDLNKDQFEFIYEVPLK